METGHSFFDNESSDEYVSEIGCDMNYETGATSGEVAGDDDAGSSNNPNSDAETSSAEEQNQETTKRGIDAGTHIEALKERLYYYRDLFREAEFHCVTTIGLLWSRSALEKEYGYLPIARAIDDIKPVARHLRTDTLDITADTDVHSMALREVLNQLYFVGLVASKMAYELDINLRTAHRTMASIGAITMDDHPKDMAFAITGILLLVKRKALENSVRVTMINARLEIQALNQVNDAETNQVQDLESCRSLLRKSTIRRGRATPIGASSSIHVPSNTFMVAEHVKRLKGLIEALWDMQGFLLFRSNSLR